MGEFLSSSVLLPALSYSSNHRVPLPFQPDKLELNLKLTIPISLSFIAPERGQDHSRNRPDCHRHQSISTKTRRWSEFVRDYHQRAVDHAGTRTVLSHSRALSNSSSMHRLSHLCGIRWHNGFCRDEALAVLGRFVEMVAALFFL